LLSYSLAVQLIKCHAEPASILHRCSWSTWRRDTKGSPTAFIAVGQTFLQRRPNGFSKIQGKHRSEPLPAPRSLLASLDACKDELFQLQVYVQRRRRTRRQGVQGKTSRHWESFMIVVKKEGDREIWIATRPGKPQFLSIAMTMNLMVLKYVPPCGYVY